MTVLAEAGNIRLSLNDNRLIITYGGVEEEYSSTTAAILKLERLLTDSQIDELVKQLEAIKL